MDIDVTSLYGRAAVHRWNRVSVGDLLERLTWSTPTKEAIVAAEGACAHPEHARLTYREADQLVNQVANALLARGLQRGDVVMLCCENSVEAYLTKLGIAKAGLVCAPVNPMMAPDVVAYLIDYVRPKFAVVDAELWARAEQPFTETGLAPGVTIGIGGDTLPGSVSFAGFVAGQPSAEPDVVIHGDDIWQILFTSGTTAMPKCVMLSHHYSYLAAYSYALTLTRGLRFESDLKLCTFLPMIYHVGDQIFTYSVFLTGGTLILGRKPAADRVAATVCAERATALWAGSPAMAEGFGEAVRASAGRLDAHSLTVLVYGWSALPPKVLATLKQLCGEDLTPVGIFGQTEAIACHKFLPDRWRETYLRTAPQQNYVGLPSPLLASTVMDEFGNDLAGQPGAPGEAVYRSPAVTAGYYKDEKATNEAFRNGWFHSGDSCAYDEDGLRVMLDRYKDIVKSGGENVSSLRVEAVLLQHPAVLKAAVVGLPHERWGEAVTAIIVRAPRADGEQEIGEEEILAFCRDSLARYETPKRVVFVDQLPETVGGKVLKYKIRRLYQDFYA